MIVGVLKMRSVHFVFVLADIICKRDFPTAAFQPYSHQSDAGEEFGKRALLRNGEIDHRKLLALLPPKRTLFFQPLNSEKSSIFIGSSQKLFGPAPGSAA